MPPYYDNHREVKKDACEIQKIKIYSLANIYDAICMTLFMRVYVLVKSILEIVIVCVCVCVCDDTRFSRQD